MTVVTVEEVEGEKMSTKEWNRYFWVDGGEQENTYIIIQEEEEKEDDGEDYGMGEVNG